MQFPHFITQIKQTRARDYKISSTDSIDLEIELTIAERDLGNCEDGLSELQEDIDRLEAVIKWRKLVQKIGISVFAAVLAAGGKDCFVYSHVLFCLTITVTIVY